MSWDTNMAYCKVVDSKWCWKKKKRTWKVFNIGCRSFCYNICCHVCSQDWNCRKSRIGPIMTVEQPVEVHGGVALTSLLPAAQTYQWCIIWDCFFRQWSLIYSKLKISFVWLLMETCGTLLANSNTLALHKAYSSTVVSSSSCHVYL